MSGPGGGARRASLIPLVTDVPGRSTLAALPPLPSTIQDPPMRITLAAALLPALLALPAHAQPRPPEMVAYQMVFLRVGPKKEVPPAEAEKMQQGHLANLIKLNADRINVLFGPFTDEGDLRGIAVLAVSSADEAKKAFAEDPYVKGGHMVVDVRSWTGPKGLFNLPEKPHTPEPFVLGFLMRGPSTEQPPAEQEKIQAAHLAYMDDLRKQGKLVVAGPFAGDTEWRGMVIYRVPSVKDAKELAAGDPAVKAGRLVLEARPWMTFKGILK